VIPVDAVPLCRKWLGYFDRDPRYWHQVTCGAVRRFTRNTDLRLVGLASYYPGQVTDEELWFAAWVAKSLLPGSPPLPDGPPLLPDIW